MSRKKEKENLRRAKWFPRHKHEWYAECPTCHIQSEMYTQDFMSGYCRYCGIKLRYLFIVHHRKTLRRQFERVSDDTVKHLKDVFGENFNPEDDDDEK